MRYFLQTVNNSVICSAWKSKTRIKGIYQARSLFFPVGSWSQNCSFKDLIFGFSFWWKFVLLLCVLYWRDSKRIFARTLYQHRSFNLVSDLTWVNLKLSHSVNSLKRTTDIMFGGKQVLICGYGEVCDNLPLFLQI